MRNAELSNKDALGYTPLDVARTCKHSESVDLLLAAGAPGMRKAVVPPVSGASKVRVAAEEDGWSHAHPHAKSRRGPNNGEREGNGHAAYAAEGRGLR